MKQTVLSLIAVLTASFSLKAATITRWDFNSVPPDSSSATGSTNPATGTGTASLLGINAGFATGTTNDPGTDNTGWNTSSYAAQGTGNKTKGVQFTVSTRGYSNIVVSWDQRPSNSASRYYRFQYSLNGVDFLDSTVVNLSPANGPFFTQTVNFSGILEANDNPNFAVRVVAEFESSATQSGVDGYVTSGATYTAGGTVRFDLVHVSGDSMNLDNSPPTISDTPDQIVFENTPSEEILLAVADLETPSENLVIMRASSNSTLIPIGNIAISGTGNSRNLQITPAPGQFGSAMITLTVTDGGGLSASDSFVITVNPLNAAPTISAIEHQNTLAGTPTAAVPFTVSDLETPAGNLTISAESSNPGLIPVANVVLAGSGGQRNVTLTPLSGQTGTAVIGLTVADPQGRSAKASFVLMVVPTATTLLCESFGYANGSLVTNSAFFWSTHGGSTGQTQVASEKLGVQSSQSEDVNAALLRGPYPVGSGTTLYASFRVNFTGLPSTGGEYLAHFGRTTATFRGRIFASTAGAATGSLRLGLSNGTSPQDTQVPMDLSLSNTYLVVIRYQIDSATSTLWINPSAGTDPGTTAADSTTAVAIPAFAFRQSAGIGTSIMDELIVGTSFSDVVPTGNGVSLQITSFGNGVQIAWPKAAGLEGYKLQHNETLNPASWTVAGDIPSEQGDQLFVRYEEMTGNKFFRLIK
jgi:hypothetical protein